MTERGISHGTESGMVHGTKGHVVQGPRGALSIRPRVVWSIRPRVVWSMGPRGVWFMGSSLCLPAITPKKVEGSAESAFILSEALPVVPVKLVKRIHKAEYVDMAELLKDNMEAERRRMLSDSAFPPTHFTNRPVWREIPDMLSWLQCFSLYTAVVASKYPEKAKAYQATLIGEARRWGGRGWLLYDSAFHQQITSFDAVDFSKINQSLYSTTFLAYGAGAKFCPECMMADHSQEECALHPSAPCQWCRCRECGGVGERSHTSDLQMAISGELGGEAHVSME